MVTRIRSARGGLARSVWLVALAALFAAPGCGDDGGGTALKLGLSLYGPPETYPDPFANVGYLRVIADGPTFEARDTFMEFQAREGLLPDIPFGEDIQVTVEGRSRVCLPRPGMDETICANAGACDDPNLPCDWAPGEVVSRGRTGLLNIEADSPAAEIAVFMMQTDSFAPTTTRVGAPSRLATPRIGFTATVLEDGKVLIVGGAALAAGATDLADPSAIGDMYRVAELYDPRSGEFVTISNSDPTTKLFSVRAFHRAVRLPDPNGPDRVAIFGGFSRVNDELQPVQSVEIFDPETLTFSIDGVPPMVTPRALHTATVVDDQGRVLLVGGHGEASLSWELWDPAIGPVKNGGLNAPRWNHTATYVPTAYSGNDVVFLFGGESEDQVHPTGELYLVQNEMVAEGGFIPLLGPTADDPNRAQPRTLHQTVWVRGQGLVYVIGGYQDKARTQPLGRVDVFQVNCDIPEGGNIGDCWRRDSERLAMSQARGFHTATEIGGNAIFIAGGCGDLNGAAPCDLDGAEVIFQSDRVEDTPDGGQVITHVVDIGPASDPIWPRALHQAVRLQSGHVLMLGGVQISEAGTTPLVDAELFNPL